MENKQIFEGLVEHLKNAFQSGEMVSKLISEFYTQTQKKNVFEDVLMDNLQILIWEIKVWKTAFRADANEQLKHQYAHKLLDPVYVAIACSVLQMSDSMESFTKSCGYLAMTFSGRTKLGKTSSHISTGEVSWSII